MKKYDVVSLGELLIDFTQNGTSAQGNPVLEANPGGAVCNVLAMLSKLGKKTAYIGKVGNDGFGLQLESALTEAGIDTAGLKKDPVVHTTLAVVINDEKGDRSFSFYRNPGADMMLEPDEVDEELVKNCEIFHFGSLSMTDEPCKNATIKALDMAKEAGILRSFDPNLREMLWPSLADAKREIDYGLKNCDILKISDNEILWFTGKDSFDQGIDYLKENYPQIKLIFLSMGPDGSRAYSGENMAEAAAFTGLATIETTGAGDTFFGAAINFVLEHGLREYSCDELKEMLAFANAAAAIITTKKGALRVMPEKSDIEKLVEERACQKQ